ncbi:MAG: HAD hydrolase family protein [Anaerolineales bacterium]|nr:HAD hydrolase family protein [Anaerolineales bacterium]
MIEIDIPGNRTMRLEHLVLDVNGTLALDGVLLDGVAEQLHELRCLLTVHMLTADTHGRQKEINDRLGMQATILPGSSPQFTQRSQKAAYVERLGVDSVVAIGNGNNDSSMIEHANLGIAVLGPEGLSRQALLASDLVCASINDALALLLNPARLVATLRI